MCFLNKIFVITVMGLIMCNNISIASHRHINSHYEIYNSHYGRHNNSLNSDLREHYQNKNKREQLNICNKINYDWNEQ